MKKKLIVILIVISSIQLLKAQQIGDGWEQTVADFSQVLSSGGYSYPSPLAGVPDTDHPWQHLFVLRHQNASNNHQLQIGASYAVNDRLFFRKIAVGGLSQSAPQWNELATRGVNTFTGDQIINGNIGIGTSTPNYKLHVVSMNDGWASSIQSQGCAVYSAYSIGPNDGYGQHIRVNNNRSDRYALEIYDALNSKDIFFVRNDGKVGINNGNPQNALDVNGTIHAREVKVDLTGWSDFVFAPTFKLKPLTEVEQYIKLNGRLPEIPSAKDVEQEGVNIGRMQAKLLQKIEELTLYVIEQNKKIEQQQLQIQELNHKLNNQTLTK